jgi:chaperone required for assembly of F1-ATPase
MKRFYKEAVVTAERGIALDGRPVKTPAKAPLILPTEAMAQAVAAEWQAQGELIDPARMPFTGLANAAMLKASFFATARETRRRLLQDKPTVGILSLIGRARALTWCLRL